MHDRINTIVSLMPEEMKPIFGSILKGGDFDNLARNFLIKFNDLQVITFCLFITSNS